MKLEEEGEVIPACNCDGGRRDVFVLSERARSSGRHYPPSVQTQNEPQQFIERSEMEAEP